MDSGLPLRGRSVVVVSSIDWDFLWQGHQEIASRLAAAGNRVLFVENTGVRTVRVSDTARVVHRLARSLRRKPASRAAGHLPIVISPLLLPFPRSRVASVVNESVLVPRLADRLRGLGADDPVVFTFLPTPNAVRLVDLLRTPRSVVVYYCIADFAELSDLGPRLVRSEDRLVRSADLVFVQAAAFARRFAPLNPRIHEFQFGVNLEVFDIARTRPSAEIARLPHPVVGYSGGLHKHVDLGLLAAVARGFPAGSVVLVGPRQEHADVLAGDRNVILLGQRPFAELGALVAGFDVALVPYLRSAYTDTVFPTKLFEYLAMGRPVVCTDLPEVRKLGLPEWAVRLAGDTESFVRAIREFLEAGAAEDAERRAALARERGWPATVRAMSSLIAERLPA